MDTVPDSGDELDRTDYTQDCRAEQDVDHAERDGNGGGMVAAPLTTYYDAEDGTFAVFDLATGDVLSTDEPEGTADAVTLANWMSERIVGVEAKRAGLIAERQVHLDRVAAAYDGRITRPDNYLRHVRTYPPYVESLRTWAAAALGTGKRRSVTVGLLTLAFKRHAARIEVTDKDAALDWARSFAPDAVQTKEAFLVSKLGGWRDTWASDGVAPAGFAVIPAGEGFEIK